MLDHDVKYLKFKTYLNTYCPHCHNSFNVEKKGINHIAFKALYNKEEIDLFLSPYLDVFEIESSVEIKKDGVLDDLICPHCSKSLLNKEVPCGECGSPVGEVIISALSKLIPFFICMKYGCEWHGLTRRDERRIKLKIRQVLRSDNHGRPDEVVVQVNRLIRGWANYFNHGTGWIYHYRYRTERSGSVRDVSDN